MNTWLRRYDHLHFEYGPTYNQTHAFGLRLYTLYAFAWSDVSENHLVGQRSTSTEMCAHALMNCVISL